MEADLGNIRENQWQRKYRNIFFEEKHQLLIESNNCENNKTELEFKSDRKSLL